MSDWRTRFGLRSMAIFGSVARGDETPASDLDLLVSFEPHVDIFTIAKFKIEVEELLGQRVDIAMEEGLKPLLREHVMQDIVPV